MCVLCVCVVSVSLCVSVYTHVCVSLCACMYAYVSGSMKTIVVGTIIITYVVDHISRRK